MYFEKRYAVGRELRVREVRGSNPQIATSHPLSVGWDLKVRSRLSTHAFYQTQTIRILTFTAYVSETGYT